MAMNSIELVKTLQGLRNINNDKYIINALMAMYFQSKNLYENTVIEIYKKYINTNILDFTSYNIQF